MSVVNSLVRDSRLDSNVEMADCVINDIETLMCFIVYSMVMVN